jgi:multiple antibiotic resistance protein
MASPGAEALSTEQRSPLEIEMLPWPEYSRFVVSLFAILTPFAAVPAFLSITKGLPPLERSRTATKAAGTAALVLVVAALMGNIILAALGTSLGSLRVGGGLVLLTMAFSMLSSSDARRYRTENHGSGGIVPLGLPLLAGPGSISSVIVEMRHGSGIVHGAAVIACVLSTCITVWAILRLAEPIGERIGQDGLNVLNRLFGLLLAAIAVEIISVGLRSLFPMLA